MSRPLQIYLDEEEIEHLERFAAERGWTKSQVVRTAIRALTRPRTTDPLTALAGMIDGMPEDLSESFDRYLDETYVAESVPAYGRRKTSARGRVRR